MKRRMKTDNIRTSYSPHGIKSTIRNKNRPGEYYSMFVLDLCSFISLTTPDHYNDLFCISDKHLFQLLTFESPTFIDYGFMQLLRDIVDAMLTQGKAYVETIPTETGDSRLKGISFRLIKYNHAMRVGDKIYFWKEKKQKSSRPFWTFQKRTIVFNLHDLGFRHRYFIKLFRKIQKLRLPLDLMQYKSFDLEKYQSLFDRKILELNCRTFWNGRHIPNQYMSEPYFLYRTMMFKELQWKLANVDGVIKKRISSNKGGRTIVCRPTSGCFA